MLILTVNSEKEYLDLIADLSKYGIHEPNRYAKPDKDGMNVCDQFTKLDPGIAEEYLGVRDYKFKVTTTIDENGNEWEEEPTCGSSPLKRKTLHFCPTLSEDLIIPQAEDYPILIMWEYDDDWDRYGSITKRYFDWISIVKIPNSHKGKGTVIRRKKMLWNKRYAKEFKEWCDLADARKGK